MKYDVRAASQYMLSPSRRKALLVVAVTPQCEARLSCAHLNLSRRGRSVVNCDQALRMAFTASGRRAMLRDKTLPGRSRARRQTKSPPSITTGQGARIPGFRFAAALGE